MNQRNKIKPIITGAIVGLLFLGICFAVASADSQKLDNITANSTNHTTDLSGDPAMQEDHAVSVTGNISEADMKELEAGDAAWLSAVTDLTNDQ